MLDALGVVYVCTGMQVGVAWTWKLRKRIMIMISRTNFLFIYVNQSAVSHSVTP